MIVFTPICLIIDKSLLTLLVLEKIEDAKAKIITLWGFIFVAFDE
jgi:hypothetical protein